MKVYRTPTSEVRALNGVTFDFPAAAVTAVVGPSGSGKSSLLRVLAGIERPSSGRVSLGSATLSRASARALRRLRRGTVGYVFQRPSDNFLPHLDVGEHLRLAARTYGLGRFDAPSLLKTLGIAHRVDHLPSELSGGEQQRAAIAQALVAGATIVVADEPTAELDEASARPVIEAVHDLAMSGVSFVVATHDPAVMRGADTVLELDHGVQVDRRPGRAAAGPQVVPLEDPALAPRGGRAALVVEGVRKTYRRGEEIVHALESIDLVLDEGGLTGLLGRSGSGKTTLLNVIAGWEHADEGRVRWDGRLGDTPSWSEVAFVPQKLGLLEELTIRENVEYPARLTGALEGTADEVDLTLEELGLDALQHRYPRETSLGEQQRTAVARAVVLRPRILLGDEPTSHQDRVSTGKVFSALARAAASGTTCLIASHNQEIAPHLDRALRMVDGRLEGS